MLNATNYSRSVEGLLKLAIDRLLLKAFFDENGPETYGEATVSCEMFQDVLHEERRTGEVMEEWGCNVMYKR